MPTKPLKNLNITDYDSRQPSDDFEFDYTYLDCQVSSSIEGNDHQKTLKWIVNDESIQLEVDSTDNNNDSIGYPTSQCNWKKMILKLKKH